MGDLSSFDRKMKAGRYHKGDDSSDDDDKAPVNRKDPMALLEEKN